MAAFAFAVQADALPCVLLGGSVGRSRRVVLFEPVNISTWRGGAGRLQVLRFAQNDVSGDGMLVAPVWDCGTLGSRVKLRLSVRGQAVSGSEHCYLVLRMSDLGDNGA